MKSIEIYSSDEPAGWIPWGTLAPLLCLLFVIVAVAAGSAPLDHSGVLDANGDPVGTIGLLEFTLLPFSLLGLIVLSWVRWVERRSLASIGLVDSNQAWTLAGGHLLGVAAVFGIVAASWIAGGFTAHGYGIAFSSPHALTMIGLLLASFALQSSVEEIVFRGWLLSVLARKFNRSIGVGLNAALFVLLHFNPGQHWLMTLNVFLFAVFTSCWALSSRNIWGVMGFHAGWNWLLATGFELRVTGLDAGVPALLVKLNPVGGTWLAGGSQGPEGSAACALFLAGGIIVSSWRWRNSGTRMQPTCFPAK